MKEIYFDKIRVFTFDFIDSTNKYAKILATNGEKNDLVIISKAQSKGRGRLGRSFYSGEGGLYMSLLIHPNIPTDKASSLTPLTAVAVCEAIEELNPTSSCKIKWVNDIYIDNKKVCGILTESQTSESGFLDYAVIGIGVNVFEPKDSFPDEIINRAGTIFNHSKCDNKTCMKLASIITGKVMNYVYCGITSDNTIDDYISRSFLIGKNVEVVRYVGDIPQKATVLSVERDFSLKVQYENGDISFLSSGDVSIII